MSKKSFELMYSAFQLLCLAVCLPTCSTTPQPRKYVSTATTNSTTTPPLSLQQTTTGTKEPSKTAIITTKEEEDSNSSCLTACFSPGSTWLCDKPDACPTCNATEVCSALKQSCPEGKYGGASCSVDNCDKSGKEMLTSVDWYKTPPSEVNQERHGWFFNRHPMHPIVGEKTVIAGVLYSFSKNILKLSVLFAPLYPAESRKAHIHVETVETTFSRKSRMRSASCQIAQDIWHCLFRLDGLPMTEGYKYRVSYFPDKDNENLVYLYDGIIPKPTGYPKVAALSCFGPDNTKDKHALVEAVLSKSPDLVVLQGDQVYGGRNILYGLLENVHTISNLTRDRPTIVQIDDHDYGQGNIWGADLSPDHNSGSGFKLAPCYVNLIQKLSLSHNPDSPVAGTTLANGITIHYGNYEYGNYIDFAILEVRKFKNRGVTVSNSTEEELTLLNSLLGTEQETWLKDWCDTQNGRIKIVLAQTPFAGLATHRSGKHGLRNGTNSRDPNGFPASGRTRTMNILQGCSPLILSGDQHLSIAVYYDDYEIGECASPAAINDIFWRVNRNAVGESHTDQFGHNYTLLNIWQVEDFVSEKYSHPPLTRTAEVNVKQARADGFMMVTFDGKHAFCHALPYRTSQQIKWTVRFPAQAPVPLASTP